MNIIVIFPYSLSSMYKKPAVAEVFVVVVAAGAVVVVVADVVVVGPAVINMIMVIKIMLGNDNYK